VSGIGGGGDNIPDDGIDGEILTRNSTAPDGWSWEAPSGGGGGAPTSATYVTITTDATLTNERTLADDGATLQVTDGGAGAAVTLSVRDNGISNAKLRDSAALSVIGRSANSAGDPADIAAASDGDVLRRSGTTLGFGAVAQSSVTNLTTDLAAKAGIVLTITAQTSNTTLVAGDSSKIYNNAGAAGEVQITLPTASAGLVFGFRVMAAQFLRVISAAGDQIRLMDQASATAGYIRANVVGAVLQLEAQDATTWLVTYGLGGPWTIDS
jgi:hypothetical protein